MRCPVCFEELPEPANCGACGTSFPSLQGIPILIDFDDSIFTRETYERGSGEVIARGASKIGRLVGRIAFGNDELERPTQRLIDHGGRVLDIGGGTGEGLESDLRAGGCDVVSVNVYPAANVAVICDAHRLPFADATFDIVIAQAVMEHVVEPHRVAEEIYRVLKPGGLVYAETPFMQQVHEAAYDFTRFTFSGHRWLFRKFEELSAGQILGPGTALLWSISYFVKSILGQRAATMMTLPFFWVRHVERWARRGEALDAASGFYFLGRKGETWLKASQLPAYYEANR